MMRQRTRSLSISLHRQGHRAQEIRGLTAPIETQSELSMCRDGLATKEVLNFVFRKLRLLSIYMRNSWQSYSRRCDQMLWTRGVEKDESLLLVKKGKGGDYGV